MDPKHQYYIEQALELAQQARFISPPNPWVGALVVRDQQVVGRGFTQPVGQAHAEVMALAEAGEHARGASLYVTLEPCSHYGRTPPCVEAVIKAGIAKVFIALMDPDPRVAGQGIQLLREAGIQVTVGVGKEEAKALLAPYLHQRKTGKPFVVAKMAVSLDGRTAAIDHTSQWISSAEARQDVHRLRAESQAIVIGSGTALHDKPTLNVRHPSISLVQQPLRVLLDGRGRVKAEGPLFDLSLAPTLVMTSKECLRQRREEWERKGAEVLELDRWPPEAVLQSLTQRGILQVLIEGGVSVHTSFIEAGCVNKLVVYTGSLLLGSGGLPSFLGKIPTLSAAPTFKLSNLQRFGDTIRADYLLAITL